MWSWSRGSGSRESARNVIAEIRRITPKPVRYLINTHGRGDHTLGDQEYVAAFPGVEIIDHPETHAYLTGSGISDAADIAKSTESRKAAGRQEIERRVAELDFDVVVPGHGDVRRGKDYLRRFAGLMDTVAAAVRRGLAGGLDAAAIRRWLDAGALGAPYAQGNPVYQYYFEQYFLDPHVDRVFAALKEGARRN